jgi:hypothetical protein
MLGMTRGNAGSSELLCSPAAVLHAEVPAPDLVDRRIDHQFHEEGCEYASDPRGGDALHDIGAGGRKALFQKGNAWSAVRWKQTLCHLLIFLAKGDLALQ